MLHADPAAAAALAEVIGAHTNGNPYERSSCWARCAETACCARPPTGGDGTPRPWASTWAARTWPGCSRRAARRCRRHHGRSWKRWPAWAAAPSGACCGRRPPSLRTSSTMRWRPRSTTGCSWPSPGDEAVRFRHDRIREAILRGLDPQRRRAAVGDGAAAGRRAGVVRGRRRAVPARDRRHRRCRPSGRQVVGLLRRAADQAALIGDHALVNALLTRRAPPHRPGRDRRAGRGAHRPPRRAGTARAGWTRRTRSTARSSGWAPPRWTAPTRRRAGEQPDPPEPVRRSDRPGHRVAARARRHRPGRGPAPRRARPASSTACTGGWTTVDSRRRPRPAGHHRPGAARRDPSDQRGPAAGLLHRRPCHACAG